MQNSTCNSQRRISAFNDPEIFDNSPTRKVQKKVRLADNIALSLQNSFDNAKQPIFTATKQSIEEEENKQSSAFVTSPLNSDRQRMKRNIKAIKKQTNNHRLTMLDPRTGQPSNLDLTQCNLFQDQALKRRLTIVDSANSTQSVRGVIGHRQRSLAVPVLHRQTINDSSILLCKTPSIMVDNQLSQKRLAANTNFVTNCRTSKQSKALLPSLGKNAQSSVQLDKFDTTNKLIKDKYARRVNNSMMPSVLQNDSVRSIHNSTQNLQLDQNQEFQEDQKFEVTFNKQSFVSQSLSKKQQKRSLIAKIVRERHLEAAGESSQAQVPLQQQFSVMPEDEMSGFNLTLSTLQRDSAENCLNTTNSAQSSRNYEFLPSVVSRSYSVGTELPELTVPWRSFEAKPQTSEKDMASSMQSVLKDKPFVIILDKGEKKQYGKPKHKDINNEAAAFNPFLAAITRMANKNKEKSVEPEKLKPQHSSAKNSNNLSVKQQKNSGLKLKNQQSSLKTGQRKKRSMFEKLTEALRSKIKNDAEVGRLIARETKKKVFQLKWDDMEAKVNEQAQQYKIKTDKDQAHDPAMEEIYSDHPSVLQQEKNKIRKKISHKIQHIMHIQVSDDESVNSEEMDQDTKDRLEQQELEKEGEIQNIYQAHIVQEMHRRTDEREQQIKICGKEKMDKMGRLLRKFAEYQTDRGKAIEDSASESSEKDQIIHIAESSDDHILNSKLDDKEKPSKNTNQRVNSIICKQKQTIKDKILNENNDTLFEAECNKNSLFDKKQHAAENFEHIGKQRAVFFELSKQFTTIKDTDFGLTDPRIKFIEESAKDMQPVKPLLNKIIDHTLTLKNFSLTACACNALRNFLFYQPQALHKLQLSQNNLQPQALVLLLEGLLKQQYFKQLILHENTVDLNVVKLLHQLVANRPPGNLETLRISHCKINWQITEELLQHFKLRCQLKKLELVKANLNEFSVATLGDVVKKAKKLEALDISWNSLVPEKMYNLLEIFASNRKLKHLNLSWNSIVAIEPGSHLKGNTDEGVESEQEKNILNLLGRLIKFNKKFVHFDLTSTGLTYFIVKSLAKQLRRSQALVAIHLSGNPGLVQENIDYLRERVPTQAHEDISRFCRIQRAMKKLMQNQPIQMIDGQFSKQTKAVQQQVENFQPAQKFILSRFLGFKEEMYGSAQWFESSNDLISTSHHHKYDCWVCGGHVFSIIFWSKKMAQKLSPVCYSHKGDGKEARILAELIDERPESDQTENYDPGRGFVDGAVPYDDLEDQVPYISGSFTGYKYRKMVPLYKVCKNLKKKSEGSQSKEGDPEDSIFEAVFQHCKELGVIKEEFSNEKETVLDCTNKEQKDYQKELLKYAMRFTYGHQDRMSDKEGWTHWFRYFPYKKPFIVNGYEINDQFQEEYQTKKETKGVIESDDDFLQDLPDMPPLSSDEEQERLDRIEKKKDMEKRKKENQKKKRNRRLMRQQGTHASTEESDIEELQVEKNAKFVNETLQLFALPVFMKPGRHQYLIKYRDSKEKDQKKALSRRAKNQKQNKIIYAEEEIQKALQPDLFIYDTYVTPREENVPAMTKEIKIDYIPVEREFDKSKSIFRNWIPDDQDKYADQAKNDFKYWKVNAMIKDQDELRGVEKLVIENYGLLKDIFSQMSCKGSYPGVGVQDVYSYFVAKGKMNDKQFNQAASDRLFISANYKKKDEPQIEAMPGNALSRFEFLEICVRIAREKYQHLKESIVESFQRLLIDHIFANLEPEKSQEWRERQLWTIEIDDLLKSNIEAITEIFESKFSQIKRNLSMQDVQQIMSCTQIQLSEDDVKYTFGMSKMQPFSEHQQFKKYHDMVLVEFLEFLGRVAQTKVQGETLRERYEFLLEDLLTSYGYELKEVVVEDEEISQSDNEY